MKFQVNINYFKLISYRYKCEKKLIINEDF